MPERKVAYQKLDNRSTPGFVLSAPSLQRLYIDCGLALTDGVVALDLLNTVQREQIVVTAKDGRVLMVEWLGALIQLLHNKKFLPKRIVFDKFDGKAIQATLHGDTHDPIRHGTLPSFKGVGIGVVEVGQKEDAGESTFFARVQLEID